MKKLLTAQDIHEARKAGLTALVVPPGALITPQARDDARSYGILLQQEPAAPAPAQAAPPAAPAFSPLPAQAWSAAGREAFAPVPAAAFAQARSAGSAPFTARAVPHASDSQAAQPAQAFAGREVRAAHHCMAAQPPVPVPAQSAGQPPSFSPAPPALPAWLVADLISRQVAQHLGDKAEPAHINAVVREVLAEQDPAAFAGSARTAVSGAQAAPMPMQAGSGAVLVRGSEALPGQAVSADAVIVADSLLPDARGPGVGYMRITDNSFTWTFADNEVLVVLEGELRLTAAGLDLSAGPGDAIRLTAGLSCTLSARGRVSCVYSAWPKAASPDMEDGHDVSY